MRLFLAGLYMTLCVIGVVSTLISFMVGVGFLIEHNMLPGWTVYWFVISIILMMLFGETRDQLLEAGK